METRFYKEVEIPVNKIILKGELIIPSEAKAIVIFSHGSGSSRFSKRNQLVANYLREKGFGTLLFDLLTEQEDQNYNNRFNIDLLAERLISVTLWLNKLAGLQNFQIGYFGASTGAASALQAAAHLDGIGAVVSRGGRPDLAMKHLNEVEAATLLIVGSLDTDVLNLNKMAYEELHCEKELLIVEGATHLFEEQGAMDKVSGLAGKWFDKHLIAVPGKDLNTPNLQNL